MVTHGSFLRVKQVLLVSNIGNVYRAVCRICTLKEKLCLVIWTSLTLTQASPKGNIFSVQLFHSYRTIGHFTVLYLVVKPLIWSEAEGDLVVIETCI